jgi:hypothetical protein
MDPRPMREDMIVVEVNAASVEKLSDAKLLVLLVKSATVERPEDSCAKREEVPSAVAFVIK